jgi:hypothetical protein
MIHGWVKPSASAIEDHHDTVEITTIPSESLNAGQAVFGADSRIGIPARFAAYMRSSARDCR